MSNARFDLLEERQDHNDGPWCWISASGRPAGQVGLVVVGTIAGLLSRRGKSRGSRHVARLSHGAAVTQCNVAVFLGSCCTPLQHKLLGSQRKWL